MKTFKKIISICILMVALSGIIGVTVFTLNNTGIRQEIPVRTKKTIEKVSSNETKTNISEIYNIYLDKEKHKVKVEYQDISRKNDEWVIVLYIYIDGKNVLEKELITGATENIKDVFEREDVINYVRMDVDNFKIIKDEAKEYLLVDIGSIVGTVKKQYYVINGNGKVLKNEGILIYDATKEYIYIDDSEFLNYYDLENKYIAKFIDNEVHALVEKKDKNAKDSLKLEEYKYYITNGKVKSELIQTYENLKIKKVDAENAE